MQPKSTVYKLVREGKVPGQEAGRHWRFRREPIDSWIARQEGTRARRRRRIMSESFFERPILNSPYGYPARYWELDESGQPTNRIVEKRRRAEFITPIPKPKKRRARAQQEIVFDEGMGLSTAEQQYETMSIVNEVRRRVDLWRKLPNENQWQVTPETARLLRHWRHHRFSNFRPFFCQIEAVETTIWLTEVAPKLGKGARPILDHLGTV